MTSRTIGFPLLVCISLYVFGFCSNQVYADQESFPFLAESIGDRVNVRAGQSANFERLCQLNKGEEVVVVSKEYSWYKIQLPLSAKSFVSKDYVQYLGKNAGGVTANDVNIRAGAGIHHTILGQLTKGEQIFIQEEFDKWYRIEPVTDSYGWVAAEYLTFKSNDTRGYQVRLTPKSFIDFERPEREIVNQDQPEEDMVEKTDREDRKSENKGIISVVGYVEPYENEGVDGIYYKIISEAQPVAYIQGTNHMLGRFLHYRVSVSGTVNQKFQSRYDYPVINVLKVRLVL